jgi:fibronectin-binding autotransporter adhesin
MKQEPRMNIKAAFHRYFKYSTGIRKLRRLLATAALVVLSCESSHATSYTWNGTANSNTTAGWSTSGAWNGGSGVPGSSDTISFDGTSPSSTVTLGGNQSIVGISINSGATGATTITSGGITGTLSIGSGGITQAASSGTVTLGSTTAANNFAINIGANETWSDASTNPLLVYANISGTAAASSSQTLATGGAGNITLAGAISDSSAGGKLAINASGGTLILSGANTYSGATIASSGTLQFNGASAMSANTALSLANNSTIALRSDTSATFAPASIASTASTATLNFDVNNLATGTSNTLTLSGTLTLATNSINTINVTGGNGYTLGLGGISLPSNSGTAANHILTINATSANVNTGVISVGSWGTTVNFDGAQAITVANLAQGSNSGNVIVIGNGSDAPTVTFQGASTSFNSRSSGTLFFTLNSGTFNLNHAQVFNNGGSGGAVNFTINGGTLDNTSGASITEANSSTLTLGGNFAYSTAAGTANNNLYLESATVIDTQASATITLNGGGTLGLGFGAVQNGSGGNQTLTVNNGAGTNSATTLQLSGYTLGAAATDTITGSGNVLIIGGVTDGTGTSSLTYSGTGTLMLTGSNTYSGTTTISSGAVQLGTGGTTGALSTTGTIVDNGNLIFDHSNALAQGTNFSSAIISGTGSVTQSGTGTTTLNVANTYSGGTTITAGEIIANVGGTSATSGSSLGTGTSTVTLTGGRLLIGSTTSSSGTFTYYNPIILNGGTLQANDGITHVAGALTLDGGTLAGSYNDTGGTSRKGLWLDGAISGSGNVTVGYLDGGIAAYAGTMVRITSSGNTYSGTITVNPSANNGGSYLFLDSSTALPDAVINLTGVNTGSLTQFSSSTLVFGTSVTSETINGLSGSGNLFLENQNGTPGAVALTVGGAGGSTAVTTNYSGVLSGTGSFIKAGTGTQTLSSATGNTYTGGTTVNGGLLVVSNTSGSATGTGKVAVNSGATLAGTGTITASGSGSNTIAVTGTSTSNRANVLVGMTSATDTTVGTSLALNATGGMTLTNANLTFNLSSSSVGTDTQLNVGSTALTFSSGARSTTLTLNLTGGNIIPANSDYVLLAGTGNTTIGGGGLTSGQFAGLTVTQNSLGQEVITGGGASGTGNLAITLNGLAGTYYGANTYLVLVDNVNGPSTGDEIEVVVVPEPGTWVLMLGGLVTLIVWQRRKRS